MRIHRSFFLGAMVLACGEDAADPSTGGGLTAPSPHGGKADELGDAGPDAGPDSGSDGAGGAQADPFALALDVTKATIAFAAEIEAPGYAYPDVDTGFSLGGTEFWQRWPGGLNPTYSYAEGSNAGRRCMYASALRFEAILGEAPAALIELRDTTNWDGSFFNWNDDYSQSESIDASGARLWAWRTGLIKWISQTSRDGTCHLPTLDLVERAAASCLAGATPEGEIQGCRAD